MMMVMVMMMMMMVAMVMMMPPVEPSLTHCGALRCDVAGGTDQQGTLNDRVCAVVQEERFAHGGTKGTKCALPSLT
jgi:hypothetical protein